MLSDWEKEVKVPSKVEEEVKEEIETSRPQLVTDHK